MIIGFLAPVPMKEGMEFILLDDQSVKSLTVVLGCQPVMSLKGPQRPDDVKYNTVPLFIVAFCWFCTIYIS